MNQASRQRRKRYLTRMGGYVCSSDAHGTICKPCFEKAMRFSDNGRVRSKTARIWLDQNGHSEECLAMARRLDRKDFITVG